MACAARKCQPNRWPKPRRSAWLVSLAPMPLPARILRDGCLCPPTDASESLRMPNSGASLPQESE